MTDEKIWTDNFKSLFSSLDVVPSSQFTTEKNMNSLTRLSILAAIMFSFVSAKVAVLILIISCVLILASYYAAAKKKKVENYCDDEEIINYDCTYVSKNQMLAGGANPKTYVPPIIAARSHDIDAWDSTGLVVRSNINDATNTDIYRSGYATCDYPRACAPLKRSNCCDSDRYDNLLTQTLQPGVYQRTLTNEPINSLYGIVEAKQFDPMLVSERRDGAAKYSAMDGDYVLPTMKSPAAQQRCDGGGKHRGGGGNNLGQRVNNDDDDDILNSLVSEYKNPNHNLVIGENIVETFADKAEELWANPRCKESDTVNRMLRSEREFIDGDDANRYQNESNVFDPRFTGYGDSTRSYVDYMTGQPRYFYSDVEAVTRPNYVSRNKIDVFPWAPTYGSDVGFDSAVNYRDRALQAEMDSTLKFRTEMQERLMRKRNAEMWQLRVAPIRTW